MVTAILNAPAERKPVDIVRPGALEVSLSPAPNLATLEKVWRDVEAVSEARYFVSWGWIGTWLATLPADVRPDLVTVRQGGRTVALGLLCRKRVVRHRFLPVRALSLHSTSDPALDCLTIEYNGFLAARGFEEPAAQAALSYLVRQEPGWDEIALDGVPPNYLELAQHAGLSVQIGARKPVYEADLAAMRAKGGDYLASLSRNTRQQTRRAFRLYEETGPLGFSVARDLEEALQTFATLKRLHQRYWIARGRPGAFATPYFEAFHDRLIRTRFAAGEIRIARVTVGEQVVGCLYSFVWRGRIYFYQSGFEYGADARLKPGLVAHCLAIQHALAAGAEVYDFLAGDSQYKRSLGREQTALIWFRARRPKLAYRVEDALRAAKQMVAARSGNEPDAAD